MENKTNYQLDVKLCNGEKCMHRFRCYRYSLYQDALFKNNEFKEINSELCQNSEDENDIPFKDMWIPNNIPNY